MQNAWVDRLSKLSILSVRASAQGHVTSTIEFHRLLIHWRLETRFSGWGVFDAKGCKWVLGTNATSSHTAALWRILLHARPLALIGPFAWTQVGWLLIRSGYGCWKACPERSGILSWRLPPVGDSPVTRWWRARQNKQITCFFSLKALPAISSSHLRAGQYTCSGLRPEKYSAVRPF